MTASTHGAERVEWRQESEVTPPGLPFFLFFFFKTSFFDWGTQAVTSLQLLMDVRSANVSQRQTEFAIQVWLFFTFMTQTNTNRIKISILVILPQHVYW